MWSGLPTANPPHETEPGSALNLSIRSCSDLIGESAATTRGWYSPVSKASGITWSRVTGALLIWIAPIIPKPPISRLGLRFLAVTNWDRPMVPPAPGTFMTWTPDARFSFLHDLLEGPGMLVVAAATVGRGDDLQTFELRECRNGREGAGRHRNRREQMSNGASFTAPHDVLSLRVFALVQAITADHGKGCGQRLSHEPALRRRGARVHVAAAVQVVVDLGRAAQHARRTGRS